MDLILVAPFQLWIFWDLWLQRCFHKSTNTFIFVFQKEKKTQKNKNQPNWFIDLGYGITRNKKASTLPLLKKLMGIGKTYVSPSKEREKKKEKNRARETWVHFTRKVISRYCIWNKTCLYFELVCSARCSRAGTAEEQSRKEKGLLPSPRPAGARHGSNSIPGTLLLACLPLFCLLNWTLVLDIFLPCEALI